MYRQTTGLLTKCKQVCESCLHQLVVVKTFVEILFQTSCVKTVHYLQILLLFGSADNVIDNTVEIGTGCDSNIKFHESCWDEDGFYDQNKIGIKI